MSDFKNDWYVIINPYAGSGKTLAQWEKADAMLTAMKVPFVATMTSHKHHAIDLAVKAAHLGYRKILAVGGDGSVHEALTGLIRYCDSTGTDPGDFYFAVIPIGSGNDWIKSLGIPADIKTVIRLMASNSFGKQDVVRVADKAGNLSYMANIGGIGFDSNVCVRVNAQKEMGKRSKWLYLRALLVTIMHLETFEGKVVVDGETAYEGTCLSLAFGTGQYSGGGMRQTSLAVIDDGLLDVLIIPKVSLLKIIQELPRLFNGTIHNTSCLIYKQCKEVRVETEPNIPFEIDGEIEGYSPMTLSVSGKQINVLKL